MATIKGKKGIYAFDRDALLNLSMNACGFKVVTNATGKFEPDNGIAALIPYDGTTVELTSAETFLGDDLPAGTLSGALSGPFKSVTVASGGGTVLAVLINPNDVS